MIEKRVIRVDYDNRGTKPERNILQHARSLSVGDLQAKQDCDQGGAEHRTNLQPGRLAFVAKTL